MRRSLWLGAALGAVLCLACVKQPLSFNMKQSMHGLRVGYFPEWMKTDPATDVDRHALEVVRSLGWQPVELAMPSAPYDSLNIALYTEPMAIPPAVETVVALALPSRTIRENIRKRIRPRAAPSPPWPGDARPPPRADSKD